MKPKWNPNRRELTVRDVVIKRYRQPAANQVRLLTEFQEIGWPERIHDPLPYDRHIDPKQRLRDTVYCLNTHHVTRDLIRFEMDGSGEGVLWKLRKCF